MEKHEERKCSRLNPLSRTRGSNRYRG